MRTVFGLFVFSADGDVADFSEILVVRGYRRMSSIERRHADRQFGAVTTKSYLPGFKIRKVYWPDQRGRVFKTFELHPQLSKTHAAWISKAWDLAAANQCFTDRKTVALRPAA